MDCKTWISRQASFLGCHVDTTKPPRLLWSQWLCQSQWCMCRIQPTCTTHLPTHHFKMIVRSKIKVDHLIRKSQKSQMQSSSIIFNHLSIFQFSSSMLQGANKKHTRKRNIISTRGSNYDFSKVYDQPGHRCAQLFVPSVYPLSILPRPASEFKLSNIQSANQRYLRYLIMNLKPVRYWVQGGKAVHCTRKHFFVEALALFRWNIVKSMFRGFHLKMDKHDISTWETCFTLFHCNSISSVFRLSWSHHQPSIL